MTYRVSPAAEADLSDIWAHLYEETGSEAVADGQLEAIARRFPVLGDYPRMGTARDEALGAGRRIFAVGKYVIVYRIAGAGAYILRVLHGARDIQAVMNRAPD